jgi:hypothetical protein
MGMSASRCSSLEAFSEMASLGRIFFLREALESNRLERLLRDWSISLGAVYWVTPPEGPLPRRVEVLGDYLIEKLARAAVAENQRRAASPKAM